MIPNLVYEYSYIVPDGIDHHLFAELCSNKILNHNAELPRYHITHQVDCKECLSKYISTVIYRSTYGINVAIGALIFLERFQEALEACNASFAEEVEDAGRLFFVAYMISAKVLYDGQPCMRFWAELANFQYSSQDLTKLELQFYDIVGWQVHIDGPTFNRCFVDMMDSYHSFLERHALPCAPPPVYQKAPKYEILRTPRAEVIQSRALPIHTPGEEDKEPFISWSMTQNIPPQWSRIGWQFLELIWPPESSFV